MNMVNNYENKQLDGITGVTPYTSPTETFLALFSADPTETGSVTNELSGGGYGRVSLSGAFSAATIGAVSNTAIITFPTATADWTAITHAAIMESGVAATDDMMVVVPLVSPIIILNTQIFSFNTSALTITAD